MSTEEIVIITVISGLITALAAIASAIAALRSASHAKSAANSAQLVENRILIREIVNSCHELIRNSSRIDNISTNLLSLNRELAIFAGQLGGNRQKLLEKEVSEDKERISAIVDSINELFSDEAALYQLAQEELNELFSQIIIKAAEVYSVKDKLETKMESFNDQVRPFRENAIKQHNT